MDKTNKGKMKIEDQIKEKELKRVDAEIARIKEEKRKLGLESEELERKSNLRWYNKPLFIQAIIAGVIAGALIGGFLLDHFLNVTELIKTEQEALKDEAEKNRKQIEFLAVKSQEYADNLVKTKANYESVIQAQREEIEVLTSTNELKEKYADKINNLKVKNAELEKKKSEVSDSIIKQETKLAKTQKAGGYVSVEKAKLWDLDLDGRPQNYTNNQFEEEKNNDGIVLIDNATNRMWEKSGSDKSMNYDDAKKYIEKLNHEKYAGHNDWRLPTLKEAITLLEQEGDSVKLFIDPEFDKQQEMIWTSDKTNASRAWVVYFSYGHCYSNNFNYRAYIRAVRLNSRSHSGPWSMH